METLNRGSKGQEVLTIQKALNTHGFNLIPDGVYGLFTETAVRIFQSAEGLLIDGITGPKTKEAIYKSLRTLSPTLFYCYHQLPYFSQRDNCWCPGTSCNVTSLAMIMTFWKPELTKTQGQLEDQLYKQLQTAEAQKYYKTHFPDLYNQGYAINTIHGMLGWLAKQYGFKWEFTDAATPDQITKWLKQGPLITSGAFTKSGHVITLIGQTILNDFIVHDPWGNYLKQYQDPNGANLTYPYNQTLSLLNGNKRINRIWL